MAKELKLKDMIGRDATQSARPLVDSKIAASTLGVSPRTVTRLCERGEIKAVKVGAQWRINRDALLEFAGLN